MPGAVCAVPVLPPTTTPGIFAFDPVPWSTTLTIIESSAAEFAGVIAWENAVGSAFWSTSSSGERVCATR